MVDVAVTVVVPEADVALLSDEDDFALLGHRIRWFRAEAATTVLAVARGMLTAGVTFTAPGVCRATGVRRESTGRVYPFEAPMPPVLVRGDRLTVTLALRMVP